MAPVPAAATVEEAFRAILGVAALVLFWLPAILLFVAFLERKRRPVTSRRLARGAMAAAVLGAGACIGHALVATGGHDVAMAMTVGFLVPILAVWQATLFCLAWLLSREPRASRPPTSP